MLQELLCLGIRGLNVLLLLTNKQVEEGEAGCRPTRICLWWEVSAGFVHRVAPSKGVAPLTALTEPAQEYIRSKKEPHPSW